MAKMMLQALALLLLAGGARAEDINIEVEDVDAHLCVTFECTVGLVDGKITEHCEEVGTEVCEQAVVEATDQAIMEAMADNVTDVTEAITRNLKDLHTHWIDQAREALKPKLRRRLVHGNYRANPGIRGVLSILVLAISVVIMVGGCVSCAVCKNRTTSKGGKHCLARCGCPCGFFLGGLVYTLYGARNPNSLVEPQPWFSPVCGACSQSCLS